MQIYNTMTRKKEELKPITEGTVKIYACGPTVYNLIHIGNARALCVFDTLRRYLEFRGYKVLYVQNFTDVDDKIIRKANELGKTASEVSENAIKEYFIDAEGLNVRRADIHPKVTENMDIIIDIVKTLIDKGYAYEADGDVYFETSKFPEYGKLSHMPLEELQAGARIEVGDKKRDPMDFAVWKAAKPGEPYWDSPFGKGRPGWHIECSAMSRHYIGDTIDIHGGGSDLIFPHHENEIAQSECATGSPLANIWMHNGMLNVDNKKMSKSAGNFFMVRDLSDKYGYEPIRFMLISVHYRSQLNYTIEVIESCKAALQRLYTCRDTMNRVLASAKDGAASENALADVKEARRAFCEAMDDDFNTADAISVVFELVRKINTAANDSEVTKGTISAYTEEFNALTGVLGLLYNNGGDEQIPAEVSELIEQRKAARKAKDFALADSLRDKITALGYIVEETRQGTVVKKA
ncbi:MAG: cysteine--tRNA ligase [Oscillospiraceae bacterium]|nr:cysteine--tRNA ligase [Oscillospiraceae bacterium]